MTNMKKFITIVLCMLLAISSVVTVSAEESKFSGIVSKYIEVSGNGDVEVLIDIAGNPGIIGLNLEISYDSNALSLKENGYVDTELLNGKVSTTITRNPFRIAWSDDDADANNYQNGTIAKLYFKMKDNFYGTTKIDVKVNFAITFIDDEFEFVSSMSNAVITLNRDKLAIKDGVVVAYNLKGETLIIASYDQNRMIGCKTYQDYTGDARIKASDVIDTDGAITIKAFLWQNLKTFMPLCKSVEEKINHNIE